MDNLDFMIKFKPDTRCIKEFKNWIVCIRAKQVTLGDAVILLKRKTASIADLTTSEAKELIEVIRWYENLCKEKFGAVKFNYMNMMMHDEYVHYHAFPRYNNDIIFMGKKFEDTDDNNILNNFGTTPKMDEEELIKIKNYMAEEKSIDN